MKLYLVVLIQLSAICILAQANRFDHYINPMYDLSLLEAENILNVNSENIDKQDIELLSIHLRWWKLNAGFKNSPSFLDNTLEQVNRYVKHLEQKEKKESTGKNSLNILEALLIKSRIELMNDNFINGVISMVKCLNYIEELREDNYDLDEFKLINGIYDYYYGYAYEHYFLLRPFLIAYPSGSMKRGLLDLKELALTSEKIVNTESNFFLGKIYLESEEDPLEALIYTSLLVKRYPDNYVYGLMHLKALKASNNETPLKHFCQKEIKKLESCTTLSQYSIDYFFAQIEIYSPY